MAVDESGGWKWVDECGWVMGGGVWMWVEVVGGWVWMEWVVGVWMLEVWAGGCGGCECVNEM